MKQKVIVIHPGDNRDDDGAPMNLYDYLVNEFENHGIKCHIWELDGAHSHGETANPEAVERAAIAITTYVGGDDAETDITGVLTDLRHYCDAHGLNFGHLNALAFSNYCEEDGTKQKE